MSPRESQRDPERQLKIQRQESREGVEGEIEKPSLSFARLLLIRTSGFLLVLQGQLSCTLKDWAPAWSCQPSPLGRVLHYLLLPTA